MNSFYVSSQSCFTSKYLRTSRTRKFFLYTFMYCSDMFLKFVLISEPLRFTFRMRALQPFLSFMHKIHMKSESLLGFEYSITLDTFSGKGLFMHSFNVFV